MKKLSGQFAISKQALHPECGSWWNNRSLVGNRNWPQLQLTVNNYVNMKVTFAVMNTTWTVVKIRPEKNSGLYRIWTHDLCDTGVALYQLS